MSRARSQTGVALLAACALAVAGCGSSSPSSSPAASDRPAAAAADARGLQAVTLPDLSKMTPSVQAQIRDSQAALERKTSDRAAPAGDLADAYGELGKLLMAADYPDAAEPCFLNAASLAADDYRWPYYLAHLYRDRGQLPQAEASFETALRLKPDDVSTLVWLGDVNLALGQPDAARPRFERALALQPTSLSARFGLGRTALAKQDYQQAVTDLEDVLARDPTAAGAHYPLALAYRGLGDVKKAEAHLRLRENREILPADPLMVDLDELLESPQSYESRGIRALDDRQWDDAAALFRKGLQLAPDSAALHHRLATALYMKDDKEAAKAEFDAAIRSDSTYFPAQYSLGVLLQEQGRDAEAIARFTAALASRPSYVEARLRLAVSLRHVGRPADALPQYAEVLRGDGNQAEALFGQAMTYVQLGRFAEARDRLRAAVKAHPDQAMFTHGLARVLAASPDDSVRDGPAALALMNQLLKTESRTADLGETLAMALAASGRYDEAVGVQQDLIQGARAAGLTAVLPRLSANLALYEQGRPCRTPWPAGEIP